MTVKDGRAQWTTHENLNQWFNNAKADLLSSGMVVDEIELDKDGQLLSEPMLLEGLSTWMRPTIDNKGGSPAVLYHNLKLQRGANRGVKSARHVTGIYATSAAGEALPAFYIFDSSAKLQENFRVKMGWLVGLPPICGQYGCPTYQEKCDSFYTVRSCGSMDDSLLNQYIEFFIVPLFPNMNKTLILDPVTGKLKKRPSDPQA